MSESKPARDNYKDNNNENNFNAEQPSVAQRGRSSLLSHAICNTVKATRGRSVSILLTQSSKDNSRSRLPSPSHVPCNGQTREKLQSFARIHFNLPKLYAILYLRDQIEKFGNLPKHSTEIEEISHQKQLEKG